MRVGAGVVRSWVGTLASPLVKYREIGLEVLPKSHGAQFQSTAS